MSISKFVTYVLLIYLVVMIGVYLLQSSLIFYPDLPTRNIQATPESIGLSYEDVELTTEDNVKLHAWYIPSNNSVRTLLFFHGNAGNISHRLESINIFNSMGMNVLIIDYRGYGRSNGNISEKGSYLDSKAAWNYLIDVKKVEEKNIVIFGRSLGSSIAAWLASQVNAGALIVESAFSSVPSMGQHIYPFLPVRWLSRYSYDTAKYIQQVNYPVLVAHSVNDEIVPFLEGQAVFDSANEPKTFMNMQGGHNNGYRVSGSAYISGLRSFINSSLN